MPMKFNFDSIMAPLGKPMSIGGVGGGKADSRIEGGFMPQPAFDPSNLQSQIGGLQEQIGNISQFDDSSLRKMIEANAGRPGFDSSQLESQIGGLQDQFSNMPQFDDSQLQSQIGGLQDQFSNMPQFDPSQLQQGISGLEDRFSNLSQFNPSALQDRLNTLEGRELPQFDPSDLQSGIAGLQDQFSNMPQFDPSQLQNRLNTLEGRELPKFNPQDYRDDFLSIAREGVQMPDFKAPDLSGYAKKEDLPSFDRQKLIEDIRGQINIPQAPDFSAYDTRFEDMQKRIDELTQNQIPQAPQAPQPIPMLPNETSVPFLPPMAPPALDGRGDFMSIAQDPNKRLREDNDPGRFRGGITPLAPIESGGQPVIDERITGIANQGLNEDVVGDDFNRRQPILRAPDQGRPDRFSVNQLNPPQREQPIGRLLPPEMTGAGDLPEGFSFNPPSNQMYNAAMPPAGFVYAYGPDGERRAVPSKDPGAAELRDQGAARDQAFLDFQKTNPGEVFFGGLRPPPPSTPGIGGMGGIPGEPEPTNFGQPPVPPSTTGVTAPATNGMPPVPGGLMDPADLEVNPSGTPTTTPGQMQMPTGQNQIDPVLLQQAVSESQGDPLLRSLYFGTQDSPGFYNQLQQAGANLIGSDVPLQQTAGLSPLELLSRQKAVAGLGGFEPFLQQNRDLVNQGIAQSRRAEGLQDPYYTQAEEIYKDTMGAYDPSMTQQFYNPYEDQVVQRTIQDVMESGDKQDIASRAREISSGAFGGSRARLGAQERRESLGEGLAQALGNIRSQGFQSAQSTGMGEFARQQQAKRTGAQGLMGIGAGRGSAASQLGQNLAGFGGQISGIGRTQEDMRAGQRRELSGYGTTGRGIAETGLGRIYEQQGQQQMRPISTLGQIGSMLPGYQASGSQIDSKYGMPTDPSAAGLGAAFSAYGALAPKQGSS